MKNNIEIKTTHEKMISELFLQIGSNTPIIYISTMEELRVVQAIGAKSAQKNVSVFVWDIASGNNTFIGEEKIVDGELQNQRSVLKWYRDYESNNYSILILKDFNKFYIGNGQIEKEVIRLLKNIGESIIGQNKSIIILSTELQLSPEIEKMTHVFDWPLPERQDILLKLNSLLTDAKKKYADKFRTEYSQTELENLVVAFQGLTIIEIELLITYTMNSEKELSPISILNHKKDVIKKSGILEWIDTSNINMNDVAGLDNLKEWLTKRKGMFTQEAIDFNLPKNPKGLLLVGVQGCGKSITAKAIASIWNFPLLRLNMDSILDSLVGGSEQNFRRAIKVAESVSPCILMIDEIEKAFAGVDSSNTSDGGTMARVFGSMLTWMQEKEKPVYIIGTANDISGLKSEFLRKGRFDELFFLDLPNANERRDIFKLHISKRKRDFNKFNLDILIELSKGYSGAEIENAVESGLYEAFYNKRDLETIDIENAIKQTIPLSVTMKEKIDSLREWSKLRAVPATKNVYSKKSLNEKENNLNNLVEIKIELEETDEEL